MIQAITVLVVLMGTLLGFFLFSGNQDKESREISTISNNTADAIIADKEREENTTPETAVLNVAVNDTNTLNLSGKGLMETPSDVFSKTNLETLNLSNNNLSGSLPGEIRFLQNLKVLNLSNNNFTGVPAEIGQLKKLEVLDLSNNQITGLPNELGNLSNLKTLNLKGNRYSEADLAGIKARLPKTVEVLIN